MDSVITTAATSRPRGRLRAGLILTIVLALFNVPFLFMPTPDGEQGPPYAVVVASAAIGLVSVVTAVIAWRSGSRGAVRITAACVIINAVSTLPALFSDVDPGVKVTSAVYILASIAAIVLLLGRKQTAP